MGNLTPLKMCILILSLQVIGFNYLVRADDDADKKDDKIKILPIEEDDGKRPLNYVELDNEYRIIPAKFDWKSAQNFCSMCVGKLATFVTAEQVGKVIKSIYDLSLVAKAGKRLWAYELGHRYWIGMTDEGHEDEWKWKGKPTDDGELVTAEFNEAWSASQPDNAGDGENCGGFWNPNYNLDERKREIGVHEEPHTLNDFPCDQKYYFICQNGKPDNDNDEQCKRLVKGDKPEEKDYEVSLRLELETSTPEEVYPSTTEERSGDSSITEKSSTAEAPSPPEDRKRGAEGGEDVIPPIRRNRRRKKLKGSTVSDSTDDSSASATAEKSSNEINSKLFTKKKNNRNPPASVSLDAEADAKSDESNEVGLSIVVDINDKDP